MGLRDLEGAPSPPLALVCVVALEAFKSPLSNDRGSVALSEKPQGGMVNGSPSGDGVFEQSSLAGSSGSTQAAFSASCPFSPPPPLPPSDVVPTASAAASYLLGPEVGKLGGGDGE
jgi:hypothetical protein